MHMQKVGLEVTDVVVLMDREQGGSAHLAANGLRLHSAFKLSAVLSILEKHNLVDAAVAQSVRDFTAANQTQQPSTNTAATAAEAAKPTRWVDDADGVRVSA